MYERDEGKSGAVAFSVGKAGFSSLCKCVGGQVLGEREFQCAMSLPCPPVLLSFPESRVREVAGGR